MNYVSPMEGMATLGKGTQDRWRFQNFLARARLDKTEHNRCEEMGRGYEQTIRNRGVCEPALEPRDQWEGSWKKGHGFEPDLSNSAVRDYRRASENVDMADLCTHLATERARVVTLRLKLARPSSIPTNISPSAGCREVLSRHPAQLPERRAFHPRVVFLGFAVLFRFVA